MTERITPVGRHLQNERERRERQSYERKLYGSVAVLVLLTYVYTFCYFAFL